MKQMPKPAAEDLDDMSEFWRDFRLASQRKRAGNRSAAHTTLLKSGLDFISNNEGAHLIVTGVHKGKPTTVDYWPGTGLWRVRGETTRNYTIRNLLRYLEVK